MKPLRDWEETIDGKRYSSKSAVLIAWGVDRRRDGDDGGECVDWNVYLYRTPGWRYLTVQINPSAGSPERIAPVNTVKALNLFGALSERCVDLEDAFPE